MLSLVYYCIMIVIGGRGAGGGPFRDQKVRRARAQGQAPRVAGGRGSAFRMCLVFSGLFAFVGLFFVVLFCVFVVFACCVGGWRCGFCFFICFVCFVCVCGCLEVFVCCFCFCLFAVLFVCFVSFRRALKSFALRV